MDYRGSESDITRILGCWCLSRWDVDKSVAITAQRSWTSTIQLETPPRSVDEIYDKSYISLDVSRVASDLLPFLITGIMDPAATYLALHPSPVNIAPVISRENQIHSKGAAPKATVESTIRSEEGSESLEDRNARIRVCALNALSWVLSEYSPHVLQFP